MNLEKTEVMWIGEQEMDLQVVVDGKTIKQVNREQQISGGVVAVSVVSEMDTQRLHARTALFHTSKLRIR